jgi:hypothetical protein
MAASLARLLWAHPATVGRRSRLRGGREPLGQGLGVSGNQRLGT